MWHEHPLFPYIEFTYCGKARYKKNKKRLKLYSKGNGGYVVAFRDLTVDMSICPAISVYAGRFFGSAYFGVPVKGGNFIVERIDSGKGFGIENIRIRQKWRKK